MSGFVPGLVLGVIRLQDEMVILKELIARTDDEDKRSGERLGGSWEFFSLIVVIGS